MDIKSLSKEEFEKLYKEVCSENNRRLQLETNKKIFGRK